MPPINIRIVTIINAILLPIDVFLLLSLVFRLRFLAETSRVSPTQVKQAPYMHRAATTVTTCTVLFTTFSLLMFGNPNATPTYCKIIDQFWGYIYSMHKLSVYAFIWFRISNFQDFFSEQGWNRMRRFATILGFLYAVTMISLQVTYAFDTYDVSEQFCDIPGRLNRPSNLVFGALLVLWDFSISGTGLIIFTRLLCCSQILGKIRERDERVAEAARNVIRWSFVALLSTPMSVVVTVIARRHIGIVEIDVTVNAFCILMQYPDAFFMIFYVCFGMVWKDEVGQDTEEF